MVGCLHRKQENIDQKSGKNRCPYPAFLSLSLSLLSTYYVYKYYKIISWKKFSQEHVSATLWPILENISSGKLNRGGNIVKIKLNV